MRSVNSKLMLFFGSVLFAALIAMGIYSYSISSRVTEEKTSTAVLNSLEQMGKNLDYQMRAVKKYMDMVIYMPEFINIMANNNFEKTDVYTPKAERDILDVVNAIFFEDSMVKEFMVFKGNRPIVNYREDVFFDESFLSEKMYSDTIDTNGATFFGGTIEKTSASGEPKYYLAYGRKLTNYNSYLNMNVGSVFLFIDEANFSTIINDIGTGKNGTVYITDVDGKILSTQDKSVINTSLTGSSKYKKAFEDRGNGYYVDKSDGGASIITYYTLPKWNLKIVQNIPRKNFIGETSNILFATIWLGLLIFALLLITSILMSRSVVKPVKKIKNAMANLQKGNFDTRLKVSSNDEFGSIAQSFNYMAVQLKELLDNLVREERRRSETEISMLQYQINPHFLYNVLGTIRLSALANKDADTAEMLQKLSRLLRRTLSNAGKMVPLDTEFSNIQDFVAIEKILYDDRIHLTYEVNEHLKQCYIPNMLLQPIVENAVLHAFNEDIQKPEILIKCSEYDESPSTFRKLKIEICDNGVGMSEAKRVELMHAECKIANGGMNYNSIGINNVDMRVKLYFGQEYGLQLESEEGKGTKAIIIIPEVNEEGVHYEKRIAGG